MSMDARMIRHAFATVVAWTFLLSIVSAASVRGTNFLVTASDPQLAREVLDAAEAFRRDLAIEWLGHELPRWSQPCPISVRVGGGAGGQTSFAFHKGVPFNWTMEIFGPRDRILDSVLPHEILHTIFATHFGRPLPRWADEGACTTVEHASEKNKNTQLLYRFLKSDRGIAFNRMFAMKEYPEDILPLYAQGYSLARFLIGQGGKRKFVDFVGEGMDTNNWTHAIHKYYGQESLSSLQIAWLDWVRDGSDDGAISQYSAIQLASNDATAGSQAVVRGQSPSPGDLAGGQVGRSPPGTPNTLTGPLAPVGNPPGDITPREPGVSGGFYSRGGQMASDSTDARNSAEPNPYRFASNPGDTPRADRDEKAKTSKPSVGAPTFYLPGGTSLYR